MYDGETMFEPCTKVIATSGDTVNVGQFVVAEDTRQRDRNVILGQVTEIIQKSDTQHNGKKVIVTVERLNIGGKHGTLHMPTLHCYAEPVLICVEGKVSSSIMTVSLVSD